MQNFLSVFIPVFAVLIGFSPAISQNDLEDMYLRKAVKEFVAKQYDEAVTDLEQVLTVNKSNAKAKKLLSKCLERKATSCLAQNQLSEADRLIKQALSYDPQNADAIRDLEQLNSLAQLVKPAPTAAPQGGASTVASQPSLSGYPTTTGPSMPQQIVISTPAAAADTHQTRVISALLQNFNKQQDIMSQQVTASSKMMMKTEDDKEKYLQALVQSANQKSDLLKNFMVIGGGILLVVILIIVGIFFFVFHKFSRSAELRTLQATDTIAALLSAPGASQGGGHPLLIGAPRPGQSSSEGIRTVTMEELSTKDPVQRAQAVEAVAAEIIEPAKNQRMEKIKRLEELLKDDNNRVRANAAKALYEIDKEASLNTLREMLESESKRMRASAVWALGEIGAEESLDLITGVNHEDDEIVKYNTKVALEKIRNLNRFHISKEQLDKLDEKLAQYADMA